MFFTLSFNIITGHEVPLHAYCKNNSNTRTKIKSIVAICMLENVRSCLYQTKFACFVIRLKTSVFQHCHLAIVFDV